MIASIGGFSLSITANTSKLNKGFKKARGMTSRFAGGIGAVGASVAGIAGPVALIAGLRKVVMVGAEFEKQMSGVKAFVTATDSELQKLSDTAESLGATTAFSATEAASAMQEMGKAGLSANQILGASEGVLTLAAAGGIEMAEAATIAAASLNQFGIPASEMSSVVDKLAKAQGSGALTLGELGHQLATAASSAVSFGMDIGETSGVIAKLATSLGAEKSGVAFTAMLTSLQAPTAAAQTQLDALGISLLDAHGNFKDLPAIVGEFNGALGGMAEGNKAKIMNDIFNIRGIKGFNTLMAKGETAMRGWTESVNDSDGFGMATAETKLDNVSGSMTKLKSTISAMAIDIFQTFQGPLQTALENTADYVTNTMIPTFHDLGSAVDGGIGSIGAANAVADSWFGMLVINAEETMNWLFNNWSTLWRDIANVTLIAVTNMGKNTAAAFGAMWDTMKSGGTVPFTAAFVDMTDGFERTTTKLKLTTSAEIKSELSDMARHANIAADKQDTLADKLEDLGLIGGDSGDRTDASPIGSDSNAASDPLKIAMRGSREAFDVINNAIKGGKDAELKAIAAEAAKQTALAKDQLSFFEQTFGYEFVPETVSI